MQLNTKRTLKVFWDHSKQYKLLLTGMLVSLFMTVSVEIVHPYFYKLFFDALVSEGAVSDIATTLIRILLIIVGIGLFRWTFERIKHFATGFFEIKVMRDLANTCFEHLHKHSYRFFSDNFTGSLVKKVNRMVRSYEGFADRIYFDLSPLFLKIIAIFGVLFWLKPSIGIVVLVWTIIFMTFNYWFTAYKWKYDIQRAKMDTKVTAALADTITNNPNLKFFASLKYELNRFKEITKE
ncbi:ABC transporter ATP-binding protein/permease [Patescibacteria group bacterium]|nr:ABC transporter ATP-binding protein/permease [Patescibacteria group bacterium]